jgi:two-component system response regulator AtoC
VPLELQPKLLRVLQEARIQPVGAEREQVVDVRIVAATHRDLEREVAERRFREDLFYRLNVVEIRLPPLQERASDIPELLRHFLEKADRAGTRILPRALKKLTTYAWPGNVRELENELQRALVLAGDKPIDERHLSKKIRAAGRGEPSAGATSGTLAEQTRAFERQVFREALKKTGGNRTHAARLLGVSRQYFAEKLRRLGLQEKKG